jgi:NAD+ synthase
MEDMEDARGLAKSWGVKTEEIPISGIVSGFMRSIPLEGTKIAVANIEARVRMSILYFHANTLGYLVAGTGDRSEFSLGYFTKWGDGGVDFLPIAHLYKTQIRELGIHLGLPNNVSMKPASPQLWPGHKASDEIPADYDKLDLVLHYLFDLKTSPSEAALKAGVDRSVVDKVLEMHKKSEHKRMMPPSLASVWSFLAADSKTG